MNLTNTCKRHSKTHVLLAMPFYFLSFWMVSCDVQSEQGLNDPSKILKNVRSITTRFTSHQQDTQIKDDKIVAVALFNVDGSVDKVTQHMTYPYNYDKPFEKEFWSQPGVQNLAHVMDGLNLGKAEYNLLYGNDWPIKYAELAEKDHPIFKKKGMEGGLDITMTYADDRWPTEINIVEKFKSWSVTESETSMGGMITIEGFDNEENKVISYSRELIMPLDFYPESLREEIKSMREKTRKALGAPAARESTIQEKVDFQYEGDNLIAIKNGNNGYRFYYNDEGNLSRSEFYVNKKMYNSRYYFYNQNGLKTKTEIYNVDGEAEYTILYEYEFFGES